MSKRLNTIKMLKIVNLDGRNASRKFCKPQYRMNVQYISLIHVYL